MSEFTVSELCQNYRPTKGIIGLSPRGRIAEAAEFFQLLPDGAR